jgi:hypothetical protein
MNSTRIATCLVLLISTMCLPGSAVPIVQAAERTDVAAVAVSWQSGPSLSQALAALGAVVSSGKLITLGGQNATGELGTPVDNVYKSAVGSGTPGPWSSGGSLDRATSSQGVVLVDGRAFLIGGRSGSSASAEVRFALVDGLGNVGTWRQTESLPRENSLAGAANFGSVIYVAGGYDGKDVRSEVYYAAISASGALTAWQTANPLPGPLRSLTLTAANGYLYAVGGSSGSSVSAQVYRAKINADSSLGSWQTLGVLPQPRERHAAVVYGGRLVVLGGLNASGGSTNTVYAARLNADGSLGAWEAGFLPALPQALDRHAAVVANVLGCGEVIYVVGGRNGTVYQNSVYYTTCAGSTVRTAYLPLVRKEEGLPPGIYGRVLQAGAGAPSVAVDLHFFNGAQWSDLLRVQTDANGNYFFPGVAALSTGQMYNVSYANTEKNNTRLAYSQSFAITAYAGGRLSGGDLEVQNINHDLPADGATVSLPVTFCWQSRSVAGDAYYLVLQDPDTSEWYWYAAGSANCFQLDALPEGFESEKTYRWSIGVENEPADNYEWGLSYYYRDVTFQAGANEIYGYATENLAALSGVQIDLDYFDGVDWSTSMQAYTDGAGKYSFADPPALAADEIYNATYYNWEENSSRLSYCQKSYITSYSGGAVWGGDFETKNVSMQSPSSGASVTLPATFCWNVRGISGDNYYLLLEDPDDPGAWWHDAGASNCYTLATLPSGWQYGVQYHWLVGVENNPQDENDWCVSYYYRTVTFLASASNPDGAGDMPEYRRPRAAAEFRIDRGE